jgi:flagellar protein FlbD
MITLHRLGLDGHTFELNPDLVVTVEANPDTVIALSTGSKVLVRESPEEVVHAVREWRVGILARALKRKP